MKQTLLRSYIRKVILESVEAPQHAVVVDDSGTLGNWNCVDGGLNYLGQLLWIADV